MDVPSGSILSRRPAEEETGVIFVGKVKNIAKNINAAFVEYRPGVNGFYSLKENSCPLYADGKPDHGPLKAGDEILVQVERSAVKTKDAVLTSNLTLTGQTAVLTAGKSSLGISAKIRDKEWREAAKRRWEETSHGNAVSSSAQMGRQPGSTRCLQSLSRCLSVTGRSAG